METDGLSIFKNAVGKEQCAALYAKMLERWPVEYQHLNVQTTFGSTHIIRCGQKEAPPLMLFHGQWASSIMWSTSIEALSEKYNVYAVDQIDDVGLSNPTRIPKNRDDYAAWIFEVCDLLRIEQAAMVGLSCGGFLASNFAMKYPHRVNKLILLCPGIPALGKPTLKWLIHGIPIMVFPSLLTAKWLVLGMTYKGCSLKHAETEMLMVSSVSVKSRIPFRPVFSNDEFTGLKMPILLLVGENESMYASKSAVKEARKLIPQIETVIIPHAGHMLLSDQPKMVVDRMIQFLNT